MAEGCLLAFGLRHVYPIKKGRNLKHAYNSLKGSDAVVYQSVRALGFEPVFYVYYDDKNRSDRPPRGVIVDQLPSFRDDVYEVTVSISQTLQYVYGGIPVRQDGGEIFEHRFPSRITEAVEWVTPMTEYNRQTEAFLYYGNEPELNWAYARRMHDRTHWEGWR